MKKLLTGAVAALTLGGVVLGAAAPAAAFPHGGGWHGGYRGGYYHGGYHRGVGAGAVIGAGLLGLAVGAAVAQPHYVEGPPPPRYVGPYYYGYWHGCRDEWRWNPYVGGYEPVQYCR